MSIREDLKAFVDGELSPERAAEVQAAIDLDPALREEVDFMKLLSTHIKSAASEAQVRGLDKALDAMPRPRPAWTRWLAYSAVGAAGVFVLGLVMFPIYGQAKYAARAEMATEGKVANESPVAGMPATGLADSADSAVQPQYKTEFGQRDYAAKKGGISEPERTHLDGAVRGGAKPSGGESQPASSAPTVFEKDRVVVRNADIGLKVPDVAKAVAETERTVMAMAGIVGTTNFDSSVDNARATMDFRIPVKNFSAILDSLGKLGVVVRKNTSGQDVTAQVADADGRIRALADEERNLIAELQQARNSSVRLEIRSRLSYVRQELEGLKSQNNATKDLAAMSRVNVSFEQSGQLDQGKGDDWFNSTTQGAGNMLGFIGRIFGVGFIYTAFLAPVWVPVVGLVWWMKRRNRMVA